MNVNVVVNLLDLAAFALVTPELLGQPKVQQLQQRLNPMLRAFDLGPFRKFPRWGDWMILATVTATGVCLLMLTRDVGLKVMIQPNPPMVAIALVLIGIMITALMLGLVAFIAIVRMLVYVVSRRILPTLSFGAGVVLFVVARVIDIAFG